MSEQKQDQNLVKYQENGQLWAVKTDEGGHARKFRVTLKWRPDDPAILALARKKKDPETGRWEETLPDRAFLTSEAIAQIQQIVALHVLTPPETIVQGKSQANPYIERYLLPDGKYGGVKGIYYRTLVIGPAPTGQMVAVDHSLVYSPQAVLMQQIAAKAQYPDACFLGSLEDDPRHNEVTFQSEGWENRKRVTKDRKVGGGGRWKFYPVDNEVGYWVNLSHPEIQKMMANFVDVLATADRRADTIRRRNAIAMHPAVGGKYAEKRVIDGKVWYVKTVVGWKSDESVQKAKAMAQAVVRGQVDSLNIERVERIDEVATEEDEAAIADPQIAKLSETVQESVPGPEPESAGQTLDTEGTPFEDADDEDLDSMFGGEE